MASCFYPQLPVVTRDFSCIVFPLDARIGARALYDYVARSDKELTFSRGDCLQVMTKTPDNNWWDGYFGGRRGFIPVAYVEVTEFKPSPSPVTPQPATPTGNQSLGSLPVPATGGQSSGSLPVPAPPQRKSSIPVGEGDGPAAATARISEPPQDVTILEEPEDGGHTPVPGAEEGVTSPKITIEPSSKAFGTGETQQLAAVAKEIDPQSEAATAEDTVADLPPRGRVGSTVKSLTKQFQDPDPAPKVLVEPHHSTQHKRQLSDQKSSIPGDGGDLPGPAHPRSASGSSKVSMLSSTFENKAAATSAPPPTRPKPGALSTAPAEVFPLVHNTNLGVSPLQMAAMQGQHSKPAIASKKPSVAAAAKPTTKSTKSTVKGKKKESGKDKEKGKPAPNPKPGFGAKPMELQAELQARVKRKQSEDGLK